MNKNDIIKYLAIAGGAYALYWYLTNYGPSGAVTAGGVSWWNSWFGSAAAAPATGTGTGTGTSTTLTPAQQAAAALAAAQAACVAPNVWNNSTGVCAPAQLPPGTSLIAKVTGQIIAQANASTSTTMTADQWGYYYNQIYTPLTPQQFGAAFPNMTSTDRGGPMTAAQWVNAVASASGWTSTTTLSGMGMVVPTNQGMGDVVGVGSRPSIPTGMGMAFGGRPIPSAFRTKETVN